MTENIKTLDPEEIEALRKSLKPHISIAAYRRNPERKMPVGSGEGERLSLTALLALKTGEPVVRKGKKVTIIRK
ncbi:MAG: hypothetical protein U9Q63_01610 [Patescibacteria group bacterium]|nr:hypothetical protein [Patescibacteria group bacterium]